MSIDLFTGMIRVCDVNGEIIQQFMLSLPYQGFKTLSFENFDDINPSNLFVDIRGGRVEGVKYFQKASTFLSIKVQLTLTK